MKRIDLKKSIFAIALIVFGVATRLLLKDVPGIETMTAVTLLGGALLGRRYAMLVALICVAIADMAIGNSSILIFTWSAWALIGLFGIIQNKKKKIGLEYTATMTLMGLVSVIFFYLWTNFGVWIIGDWYPHTAAGLMQSYAMGLPFLRPQILGNLVIVPVLAMTFGFAWEKVKIRKKVSEKEFSVGTEKV